MNAKLLAFCFRSLHRQYGAGFLSRVVLAHPAATLRGVARYVRSPQITSRPWNGGPASLVGIGYCVKPLNPPCPAGRASHDCRFFESARGDGRAPCRNCLVRLAGELALACGSALYVMTSAQDILRDLLRPALERRRFRSAVLAMCRYSFEPMRLALSICGIEAWMIPFVHGDCRDYAAWLQADMGVKTEQTALDEDSFREMMETLSGAGLAAPPRRFRREGNVYTPD